MVCEIGIKPINKIKMIVKSYTHTLIHNKNENIKVPTEIHIIEGQHKTIDKVFALSDLISNLFSL